MRADGNLMNQQSIQMQFDIVVADTICMVICMICINILVVILWYVFAISKGYSRAFYKDTFECASFAISYIRAT